MAQSMRHHRALQVEVVQRQKSLASSRLLDVLVRQFVSHLGPLMKLVDGYAVESELVALPELHHHVERLWLSWGGPAVTAGIVFVHIYRLQFERPPRNLSLECGQKVHVAHVTELPFAGLDGLWESLMYDIPLKQDLLAFTETTLRLANTAVDRRLVSCGHLLVLHGPPGTGKTSLCRALAHKTAVRLTQSFPRAVLVELQTAMLLTPTYSDLVMCHVHSLLEDPGRLVCILLDDADSMVPSPTSSALTQLDVMRARPNALLLATSKVTCALNGAFADRADLVRFVGPPGVAAAYRVLCSAATELMRNGILSPPEDLFPIDILWRCANPGRESRPVRVSAALLHTAGKAAATPLSGRALRSLPQLALARLPMMPPVSPLQFSEALDAAFRCYVGGYADPYMGRTY